MSNGPIARTANDCPSLRRFLAHLADRIDAQPDEGDGEDPPLPAERKGEKPQECAQDHKLDGPGEESDIAHRIHHPG
jgi:hypothetical protein